MRFALPLLLLACLAFSGHADPVLIGGGDGWLSWTNDTTSGYYRVEWTTPDAGALGTNWRASWSRMVEQVAAESNAFIAFGLPVHFRILHTDDGFPEEPAADNLTNGTVYDLNVWSYFEWQLADAGRLYSVDWLNGTNWSASWHDLCNIPATGLQMSCYAPMVFRLRAAWDVNNSSNLDISLNTGANVVYVYCSRQTIFVGRPGAMHQISQTSFYMDQYEVSVDLWNAVQAWGLTNGYDLLPADAEDYDFPVAAVSWYDAAKWCNARSERDARTPCYYTDTNLTTNVVWRTGTNDLTEAQWRRFILGKNTNAGWRLPTEAEWEIAARRLPGSSAGHTNAFPWNCNTLSQSMANYWQSGDQSELMPDQRTPIGGWS